MVDISPAIRHAAHNLAIGVPPPPCLVRRAHYQWYRLGRPGRRYALLRRKRLEDVRVDDGVPRGGGGKLGVRLLGALLVSVPICFVRPVYGVAAWTIMAFANPQNFGWGSVFQWQPAAIGTLSPRSDE